MKRGSPKKADPINCDNRAILLEWSELSGHSFQHTEAYSGSPKPDRRGGDKRRVQPCWGAGPSADQASLLANHHV